MRVSLGFALLLAALFWSPFMSPVQANDLTLPVGDPSDDITVSAKEGQRWREGSYEVWALSGECQIRQGTHVGRAQNAVVWIDRATSNEQPLSKMLVYLEQDVVIDFGRNDSLTPHRATGKRAQSLYDRLWFGRFHSQNEIHVHTNQIAAAPDAQPTIVQRARQAWDNSNRASQKIENGVIQRAQFAVPMPGDPPLAPPTLPSPAQPQPQPPFAPKMPAPGAPAPPPGAMPVNPLPAPGNVGLPAISVGPPAAGVPVEQRPAARLVKIEARNSIGFNAKSFPEGIVFDTGVRLVAEGISNVGFGGYHVTRFDIETDRVVIWADLQDLNFGNSNAPADSTAPAAPRRPIELYMEGNIVFREGDRVIYADRMYYNITERYGVVLRAEMLTPVPEYQGLLRLKADVLQQVDQQRFQAFGAALTSSRLGVPRYWFQTETVQFENRQRPLTDPFTGAPVIDPVTGRQAVEQESLATASNNWIHLMGVPVFYWPTIATDLKEPSYYLDRVQLKSDSVFGTQVLLDWDAYQLFGIRNKPEGTKWQLATDVLSERGFGLGTTFRYDRDQVFGIPGPTRGLIDAWGIRDTGVDNLGLDRRALAPEEDFRGRVLWQHRQMLPEQFQFTAELGLISDRNFLEQFYEREWDQLKDQSTGIELKHFDDNSSWAISADARINDFFTQTQWLPRFDHFLFGHSFLDDWFTWHAHSHVGYAKMKTASAPLNAADAAKFDPLAWEADREGVHAATRHEIDMPLNLGPVKVVPYALGEIAHWGEDLNGVEVTRMYGQAGVRTSLPFWWADPSVQNELFNLNGLAHKVSIDGDFYFADANRNMDRFPLYENLDDDAIEHFRRRFFFNTFNGTAGNNVALKFDERFYALRSGMQSWVSAPSTEIADDLMVGRLGLSQRWQTKRGLPGQQRIIDWIVLDVNASVFADPNRDNFGETLGMIDYDFRWHVGDRLTLLSDGFADVFSSGLRTASLGGVISRPENGSAYLGFRTIDGPINSHILTGTVNYRMTEKWIATAGASYDFGEAGNIGQLLNLTRIGESFLVKVGFNWDVSRGNVGANFSIEPRFLSSSKLGRVGGVQIPPAGVMGLE